MVQRLQHSFPLHLLVVKHPVDSVLLLTVLVPGGSMIILVCKMCGNTHLTKGEEQGNIAHCGTCDQDLQLYEVQFAFLKEPENGNENKLDPGRIPDLHGAV